MEIWINIGLEYLLWMCNCFSVICFISQVCKHEKNVFHSLSITAYPLQGRGGVPISADIRREVVGSSSQG